MTEHLLLAATHSLAAKTARRWGWEPAALRVRNRLAFIDPAGDLVLVCSNAEEVGGIDIGAKVYLGEGWVFAHGAKDELRQHAKLGGPIIADHWKNGVVTFGPPKYEI